MRKLLVTLFLLGAFIFYPYASADAEQEKKKGKVVIIDPDDTAMIHDWPLWLFNHGYTSYYDSNWMNNYRGGHGAVVIRKPLSFGESFLYGLGKGISKGVDNYYRARQQKQDIAFKMGLLKLKWASEGYRSKYSQPQRARSLPEYRTEYKMSPEEKQANLDRIEELDHIIKLKKERANLDKLFQEAGWLDKDRIEYLDKYYPLPLEKETKVGWLDSFDPLGREGFPPLPEGYRLVRPGEKEEDDFTKYMRPIGAMLPWEYKTMKLNEYLKSQGLSLVPTNLDVNQVYDGDWIIFWDGEKWGRKKKE